jgi:trk system potassium uptake protein TrkA
VEEMLMHPSEKVVYSAGNGEVEIYELRIPDEWNDRTLGDLLGPLKECYPVAVTRAGRSFLPTAETRFHKGDLLNVSSTFADIGVLTARLSNKAEA